jgi:hypothetical protein
MTSPCSWRSSPLKCGVSRLVGKVSELTNWLTNRVKTKQQNHRKIIILITVDFYFDSWPPSFTITIPQWKMIQGLCQTTCHVTPLPSLCAPETPPLSVQIKQSRVSITMPRFMNTYVSFLGIWWAHFWRTSLRQRSKAIPSFGKDSVLTADTGPNILKIMN